MEIYLEAEMPEELCQHLFSFMKKEQSSGFPAPSAAASSSPNSSATTTAGQGKEFHVKGVAVAASQTVCAPITNVLTSDLRSERDAGSQAGSRPHSTLAEKLHGLTEKLQHGLGSHARHDGAGDGGKRSRAGSLE